MISLFSQKSQLRAEEMDCAATPRHHREGAHGLLKTVKAKFSWRNFMLSWNQTTHPSAGYRNVATKNVSLIFFFKRLWCKRWTCLILVDLHAFYSKVQKVGGYEAVMTNRLWKSIFDELSGNHNSTSAATVIRRHYERYVSILKKDYCFFSFPIDIGFFCLTNAIRKVKNTNRCQWRKGVD